MSQSAQTISRFLVIDAEEENLTWFKVKLGMLQYSSITLCQTVDEAMAALENKSIQFIIARWELTPVSGTAFVQRVLAMEKYSFLPFIIFSDRITDDEEQFLNGLGVTNIMPFPCEDEHALDLIKVAVKLEENLNPAEVHIRNANNDRLEKQYVKAVNTLKPALVKGPYHCKAKTLLARIMMEEHKFEEAEAAIKDALEDEPENLDANHVLAKVYANTNRHSDAIKILTKSTEPPPYHVEALMTLGISYVEEDEHGKARESFSKARSVDPTNPKIDHEEGKLAFKEGDFDLAANLLSETQNTEDLIRSFNNIAIGMVAKKEFDKGINTYEAALKILREKGLVHLLQYNLGLALKKNQDYKEAFRVLAECFEHNPSYTKAYAALVHLVKEMEAAGYSYDRNKIEKLKDLNSRHQEAG